MFIEVPWFQENSPALKNSWLRAWGQIWLRTHVEKVALSSKLTLNVPIPNKVKKLSYIFIFTLLCGASKGFMKAFKKILILVLLQLKLIFLKKSVLEEVFKVKILSIRVKILHFFLFSGRIAWNLMFWDYRMFVESKYRKSITRFRHCHVQDNFLTLHEVWSHAVSDTLWLHHFQLVQ